LGEARVCPYFRNPGIDKNTKYEMHSEWRFQCEAEGYRMKSFDLKAMTLITMSVVAEKMHRDAHHG